jgi:Flp pilus assembly protein TadB
VSGEIVQSGAASSLSRGPRCKLQFRWRDRRLCAVEQSFHHCDRSRRRRDVRPQLDHHAGRAGNPTSYRYLEHGAFYAIIALAVMMFLGTITHIPEVITALIGGVFIAAAFLESIRYNRCKRGI